MPRIKPTEVADVIGELQILPAEAAGDYIESKKTTSLCLKEPNWDSPGDSEALMLLHAKFEHDAMLQMQKTMLKNNARIEQKNRVHTAAMNKMQDKLRNRFIRVNNFFKDCEEKKRKAEETIESEMKQHEQLAMGIDYAKKSVVTLDQLREDMKGTLKQYRKYERVTKEAVAISPIYESVKDCMGRADALMIAHDEIHRTKEVKLEHIDQMRHIMVTITQEAAMSILGMQNDLLELERCYKGAVSNCQNWEKCLARAKKAQTDYQLEKWRTYDGIYAIFGIMWSRLGKGLSNDDSPIHKLNFICKEALLLQDLVQEMESEGGGVTHTERHQHLC